MAADKQDEFIEQMMADHNPFTCLQVDTLIQPEICIIESKEVMHPISPSPINTVAFQPRSVGYLVNMSLSLVQCRH
jgi:hypothetical protein